MGYISAIIISVEQSSCCSMETRDDSAHFQGTTEGLSVPHLMCWQTEGTFTTGQRCCYVFVMLAPDTKLQTYVTHLLTYTRAQTEHYEIRWPTFCIRCLWFIKAAFLVVKDMASNSSFLDLSAATADYAFITQSATVTKCYGHVRNWQKMNHGKNQL